MLGLLLIGILLSRYRGAYGVIGFSLVIIVAALALGGSLGFLFGIPRVNAQTEIAVATPKTSDTSSPGTSASLASRLRERRLLSTNTNLEKVSDWLTTMLVGVGLTQLGNVNGALVGFRNFLNEFAIVYPDAPPTLRAGLLPAIGPMLLMTGIALGFVYFYVFTRVVIAPKFDEVEGVLETGRPVISGEKAVATLKEVAHELPLDTIATRNVVTSNAPTIDDSLSVMFEALYQPSGYKNALRIAEALRGTEAIKRPDYWLFVAAARGQEYKVADTPEGKAAARLAVMDASRRAVELNASYRARLWVIADPEGQDDDLADFRADPEFLQIVGKSSS